MFKNDLAQTREASHRTKCILNLAAQDFPRVPNLSPFCVCECVGETLAGRIWRLQLLAQQDPTANKTENLKASSSWRKHLQCIYSPM